MTKHTPLYDQHVKANAKMVDFSGWQMPLHYGSQLEEHHFVRREAGMFDVSHMGVVDLRGNATHAFLQYLLANNVDKLVIGKALYSCMLNENGGVIDDLIVYKISDQFYRLVINAGTREKDIAWLQKHIPSFDVTLTERTDLAMIAVQGPLVKNKIPQFLPPGQAEILRALKPFTFALVGEWLVARTGYTGEDGFEIILPSSEAAKFWQACVNAGIHPCGLGARDTLRLEAGLNLYGHDMNEAVSPLESNLTWTVAFEPTTRAFIGREALEKQLKDGVKQRLVGLVLEGAGIIRDHQAVTLTSGTGKVTSGGYSPTLQKSIALATIPVSDEASCTVDIRNKLIPATIIKPPFVRHGKKMF